MIIDRSKCRICQTNPAMQDSYYCESVVCRMKPLGPCPHNCGGWLNDWHSHAGDCPEINPDPKPHFVRTGVLPDNKHPESCQCSDCWCEEHQFSLRRPTRPPHTWKYPKCPFGRIGD